VDLHAALTGNTVEEPQQAHSLHRQPSFNATGQDRSAPTDESREHAAALHERSGVRKSSMFSKALTEVRRRLPKAPRMAARTT
jgi:hypothetical protein